MRDSHSHAARSLFGLGRLARRLFSTRRHPVIRSRPLAVEALEARDVPTVIYRPNSLLFRAQGQDRPLIASSPYGYSPSQMRTAYGFNLIMFGSTPGDGTGQTIGIVDAGSQPNLASDLHAFDQQYGLPDPVLTQVNQNGGSVLPGNQGWGLEISLDVEWAHAIAPGAKILFVGANSADNTDLDAGVRYAATTGGASVVSMSYGGGEGSYEYGEDSNYTTPGVTFVAASGDSGAPPIYPSSSPNVLSIGGTTLKLGAGSSWFSETAWSASGGGLSSFEAQPSYQQGLTISNGSGTVNPNGKRATPDVAYDGDAATGVSVYDSFDYGAGTPWVKVGGTSAGAPQWSALIAIANQGRALIGLGPLSGASQTLPAIYALSASDFHDITSGTTTGTPNYTAGPGFDLTTGLGTPLANLVASALVTGPSVVAADPSGTGRGTVASVTFTFNQPMASGSFNLGSVDSFTGPNGPIIPTGVNPLSNTQFQVTFAPQSALGTYTLVIGPNITNLAGVPMDQNQNGVPGEIPADEYTDTFTITNNPVPTKFEFEPASAPLASGYAQVTENTTYSTFRDYGWQSGVIQSRNRGTGNTLTQSFDFTPNGTFAVNLANGWYNATVTMGDALYMHDDMGVFFQGTQVDTVTTAANQFVTNTYEVQVTNGQLVLGLQDLGGSDPNVVINAMTIAPDTTGPRVVSANPQGSASGPVSAVTLTFSEPILASSFTLGSVDSLTGPQGAITPTGIKQLSATQFQVTFPAQSQTGTYTLVVGPNITDPAGNAMDQNQNGVNGEVPADEYTDTFTISAGPIQYEFEPASAPLASGYTQVTEGTAYSAALGYGWLSGAIDSRNRGTGNTLTQSFCFTTNGTFAVNLANGSYYATVTMGDALYAQGAMGVSFQGTQVDSFTTAAGQFITRTYLVTVSNGQLDLGLAGLGPTSPYAVINALTIASAKPSVGQYEFEPASAPLASGYTQVTENTTYNAAQGYGWLSGTIASRNRGTGSTLTQSFDFTTSGTFAVNLANGSYYVTVTMGDALYAQGAMGVSFQGTRVDSFTTAAGQFITRTYLVTVSNGQLDLGLAGLGPTSPYAVINALTIAPQ
jgi:fibronectin type 3 domain-containing protein